MQNSFVRRFLFNKLHVRGSYVELTDVWLTVSGQKEYPEGVRQFLGELIVANILMTSNMKLDGKLTTQINDNPKIDLVISECTSDLKVRAMAKFSMPAHKDEQISYTDCINKGVLVINVSSNTQNKRYQSIVTLSSHDLATALDEYMLQSEQLKSLFVIAYTDNRVVGFMLQQLPEHNVIEKGEIERVFMLANTLTRHELLNKQIEILLAQVFPEDDIVVFDRQVVEFKCTCSHDRVLEMLRNLGKEEVLSIIAEKGKIEVTCDFCNMHYVFSNNDIQDMFNTMCVNIESISKEIH